MPVLVKAHVEIGDDVIIEIERESEKIGTVLEEVGRSVIQALKAYTGRTEDGRVAHPGGWGDRTGKLAASYTYTVERLGGGGSRLTLANSAGHAVLLEAHDGYYVLRGIEEPGNPLDVAFRTSLARHLPGWELRA